MSRDEPPMVSLGSKSYPAVQSHLSAWIDERGLVVEGQDLGSGVSAVWGDSDYEYWVTVKPEHLDRVLAGLASKLDQKTPSSNGKKQRDRLVLEYLELAFGEGLFESSSGYRRWLGAIHVPSEFFSYG